jgi:hypothetical protein
MASSCINEECKEYLKLQALKNYDDRFIKIENDTIYANKGELFLANCTLIHDFEIIESVEVCTQDYMIKYNSKGDNQNNIGKT